VVNCHSKRGCLSVVRHDKLCSKPGCLGSSGLYFDFDIQFVSITVGLTRAVQARPCLLVLLYDGQLRLYEKSVGTVCLILFVQHVWHQGYRQLTWPDISGGLHE
jgi:hypothetical protein